MHLAPSTPGPIAEHLVASTRGRTVFTDRGASWLWRKLAAVLPDAFSCVFMPDHIHLVAPPGSVKAFAVALRAYLRKFGVRFDILEPVPLRSEAITIRAMRYGFHNPVRSELVDCPWAWGLSSLRDLGESVHPLWTEPSGVASRLRLRRTDLLRRTTVTADLRPTAPTNGPVEVASWDCIVRAAASALRMDAATIARSRRGSTLIVQLYRELNPRAVAPLQERLGIAASTIRRRSEVRAPALDAAMRCLSDPRLR